MAKRLNAVYQPGDVYDPIVAGSIDGTGTVPHDKDDPKNDKKIKGDPRYTIFVGRISYETTEQTLHKEFSRMGEIRRLKIVRDIVTDLSRGYAFIEYEHSSDCRRAYERMHKVTIDGRRILVDIERERVHPGWVPRRLGGGVGGKKESGQLRFGGRDRPHRLFRPKYNSKYAQKRDYNHRNEERRDRTKRD